MKNISRIKLFSAVALAGVILAHTSLASAPAAKSETAGAARRIPNTKARVSESSRAGTVIAPDGQVAVTSIDRKWDKTTGTGTLNEAATTPDGRIYTREANLTRNPDGIIAAKGTFTDFDGSSFNYTETTKQTAKGPVVLGRMVDIDGKIATYETSSTKMANNQTKRTTVITHPDGTKETRVELLALTRATSGS